MGMALLRPGAAVVFKLAPIVAWCGVAVVQQRRLQRCGSCLAQHHPFMHQVGAEARRVPPKQAQHMVWGPATVANPVAAKLGQPRDFISTLPAPAYRLADLQRQRIRYPFVGVDRQHPVAAGQLQGAVFLRPKTGPVICHMNLRAKRTGQLHRAICAAAVEQHNFVSKGHAGQTGRNVVGLVAGDDDDAKCQGRRNWVFCQFRKLGA